MTNEGIVTSPKRKPHEGSHACNKASSGLAPSARLTKRRHYNLVFLHARRKTFPAFADIAAVLAEVWPWGEMAEVAEVASRLSHQFPVDLVEAAIWKVVADAAAAGTSAG